MIYTTGIPPISAVDEIRQVLGVDWADPVRGTHVIVELHGTKLGLSPSQLARRARRRGRSATGATYNR